MVGRHEIMKIKNNKKNILLRKVNVMRGEESR